jgi:hypothetical protein
VRTGVVIVVYHVLAVRPLAYAANSKSPERAATPARHGHVHVLSVSPLQGFELDPSYRPFMAAG